MTDSGPSNILESSASEYRSGGCSTKCCPALNSTPTFLSQVLTVPASTPSSCAIRSIDVLLRYFSAHLLTSFIVALLYGRIRSREILTGLVLDRESANAIGMVVNRL